MNYFTCTECGKTLPETSEYFPMDLRRSCKNSTKCLNCFNADCRKKYAETRYKQSKQYRESHAEELAIKKKQYYEANKEKVLQQHKEYYKNHLEDWRNNSKEWRKNNPEALRKHTRLRYERHKEHMLSVSKNWKDNNKDKVIIQDQRREAKKRSLPATLTVKQWHEIVNAFDGKCAYCGEEKPLTQDHFIPVSKNGGYTKENIIPSCLSCNCSKIDKDFQE
jgi:hypothetical protein